MIFKETKTLITIVLVGLFLFACFLFVIKPLSNKAIGAYLDQKKKTIQIENLKNQTTDLEKLKTALENNQSEINQVINFIPQADNTNFVIQVDGLAYYAQNIIKSIKMVSQTTASGSSSASTGQNLSLNIPDVDTQTFELQTFGNFPALVKFVNGLENLSQANAIFGLVIRNDDQGKINTTLTGVIFNKKEK